MASIKRKKEVWYFTFFFLNPLRLNLTSHLGEKLKFSFKTTVVLIKLFNTQNVMEKRLAKFY